MSAILAVCGAAFCAMVSDGRMVEEPVTGGKPKILTEQLPKVRKVNPDQLEFKEFKVSKESKAKLVQWVLEVLLVQLGQEV